ncbi:MAG: bifunctional glutamate--cysteine ligase GshA/glutathione synthetase GshB [Lactobacillales bacterium]|jgi:glutamate--cysteine ligase|nr:bifunctional glutamate--cysteine ligase GshA/glutathione synthetase GshB [Lactobacillales bacterium]
MINFKKLLENSKVKNYILSAHIGIEREAQRINASKKRLTKKAHPKTVASRDYNPYIQTDYAESQLEFITPITNSVEEAMNYLSAITKVALTNMDKDEVLWPLSMPPALPEDAVKIKVAKLSNRDDVAYRKYLSKVYGKRKQMISGIHFNFSFGEDLIKALHEASDGSRSLRDFSDEMYMKVARGYVRYHWIMTYLFGAAPTHYDNFFDDPTAKLDEPIRSIRNSKYGYRNLERLDVDFSNIESYVTDIENLVEDDHLVAEKEYYNCVRIKGAGKLRDILNNGISYLEFRNLDVNPFELTGVSTRQLHFMQLLILWLLFRDENPEDTQGLGNEINDAVALENPNEKTAYYNEGKYILNEIEALGHELELEFQNTTYFKRAKKVLDHPEETLAARMLQSDPDWFELAEKMTAKFIEPDYLLNGFEDFELSTQIFIYDAIRRGIMFEIVDRTDNFIRLTSNGVDEYVRNGNMTSHDTLISMQIMENKVVTKRILAKNGFSVAGGFEFEDLSTALLSYGKFEGRKIVIKPKSTNMGLGITILPANFTREEYQQALAIAFNEDVDVLVEYFFEGTEYRFFVVGGKCTAVCKRVGAHVVGDGASSVRELVEVKNASSWRGTGYDAPLKKIELGEIELLNLQARGIAQGFDYVPAKGENVILRENSNLSTGGDSINVTDEIHASFKEIAQDASKHLESKVCGLDIIIQDINEPAAADNHIVVEANFNPMMHMHVFPAEGASIRVTDDVLDLLYPGTRIS